MHKHDTSANFSTVMLNYAIFAEYNSYWVFAYIPTFHMINVEK